MVEKVPDSTYDMIGGLDKQIKEIKEVIELPVKTSRALRESRHCPAKGGAEPSACEKCSLTPGLPGSVAVRTPGNREDTAGESCGSPHRVLFSSESPAQNWSRNTLERAPGW